MNTAPIDRIFRLPRIWSNRELERFAHLFRGDVVNVSAWKDIDKEGRTYRQYFANASSYSITNYKADARGWQGVEGEIFLDLELDLDQSMTCRFDVVFNHTTLEHVYKVHKAFANLCAMTRDVVIVVVPFLQPYHAEYGDYWRFTPLAIKNMFEEQKMGLLYSSFNTHARAGVYVFAIGSKNPEAWKGRFDWTFDCRETPGDTKSLYIGERAMGHHVQRLGKRANRLTQRFNRFYVARLLRCIARR